MSRPGHRPWENDSNADRTFAAVVSLCLRKPDPNTASAAATSEERWIAIPICIPQQLAGEKAFMTDWKCISCLIHKIKNRKLLSMSDKPFYFLSRLKFEITFPSPCYVSLIQIPSSLFHNLFHYARKTLDLEPGCNECNETKFCFEWWTVNG